MDTFQNGYYNYPGGCGTNNQIPAVAFVNAGLPEFCPAPGADQIATQTLAKDFFSPRKKCRLEFDDIDADTSITGQRLIVIGSSANVGCSDEELREEFDVDVDTEIVRLSGHCNVLNFQAVTGTLGFSVDSTSDTLTQSQFSRNAQGLIVSVQNSSDCAFTLTRGVRCSPCDNEFQQTFGSNGPIVVGNNKYFGYLLDDNVSLTGITLCACEYSVDDFVGCRTPEVALSPAPVAPACPPYADYTQVPANNGTAPRAFINGNGR